MKMNDEITHINTDNMLNEVKYNIVVATLVKNRHERMVRVDEGIRTKGKEGLTNLEAEEVYSEALTLIETFVRESHC